MFIQQLESPPMALPGWLASYWLQKWLHITKRLACRIQGTKNELADSFFGVLIQFSRTQAGPRRAGWGKALTLHRFGQRGADEWRLASAFALLAERFALAALRLLLHSCRFPSVSRGAVGRWTLSFYCSHSLLIHLVVESLWGDGLLRGSAALLPVCVAPFSGTDAGWHAKGRQFSALTAVLPFLDCWRSHWGRLNRAGGSRGGRSRLDGWQ